MRDDHFAAVLDSRHGLIDLEEIGRGGMGVVYRAWDPQLQRYVAVKRLSAELFNDDYARHRFRSEMVLLGKIRHPAVVQIHYASFAEGTVDGRFPLPTTIRTKISYSDIDPDSDAYFVMDHIDGVPLSQLIRHRRKQGLGFSAAETVELLEPIAAALDHLHLKINPPIIHRDIKPDNILVPHDSSGEARALLTDFGISLRPDETRLTSLSLMVGTEKYLAPELLPDAMAGPDALGHNHPTDASDNYALTLVAFEMLTLHPLKETMSTSQWRTDRPFPDLVRLGFDSEGLAGLNQLKPLFEKALTPEPAYRYPTATAFIRDLATRGAGYGPPRSLNHPAPTGGVAGTPGSEPSAPVPSAPVPATPSSPSRPTAARRPPVTAATIRRRRIIALTVIGAVLFGIIAAVGSLVFGNRSPAWGPPETELVAAFPELLPERQNGPGWNATVCGVGHRLPGTVAAIDCESTALDVSFVRYPTPGDRDFAFERYEKERLASTSCQIDSISDPAGGYYYILPVTSHHDIALRLSGEQAEQLRLSIPVC